MPIPSRTLKKLCFYTGSVCTKKHPSPSSGEAPGQPALTGGVVFDPVEELRAGSLHQFPSHGLGPAGPDLIRGGIAIGTFAGKDKKERSD